MQVFTSEELQRRPAEVQQSALVEPTFITFHGRPRLVMMSLVEFERMKTSRHKVMKSATFSADFLAELQLLADAHGGDSDDLPLAGGAPDDDTGIGST
jgi:hypothetical protein